VNNPNLFEFRWPSVEIGLDTSVLRIGDCSDNSVRRL